MIKRLDDKQAMARESVVPHGGERGGGGFQQPHRPQFLSFLTCTLGEGDDNSLNECDDDYKHGMPSHRYTFQSYKNN